MPRMNIFVPIRKVDEANRIVYGVAAQEVPDRSREIMDYATTKPEFEKWSGEMHKDSGGKSLGNLRAMHGKIAAGRVDALNFNDAEKAIEIAAKVVDDNEWTKVVEGVYTGFSMGGSYAKRWKDEADNTLTRYTAVPQEISLVDRPCIPTAKFQVVKADGAAEERPFKSVIEAEPPTNDAIARKATELAKAAGDEKAWPAHIETARAELTKGIAEPDLAKAQSEWDAANGELAPKIEVEPAPAPEPVEKAADPTPSPVQADEWEQVWRSRRDGSTFAKKDELRAYHAKLDAEAATRKLTGGAMDDLAALAEKVGVEKRDFTADQRKHMAHTGEAMSDGSFPIQDRQDLKNAIQAYGRAKDKQAARRHIMKRASELSMMDEVPHEWSMAAKAAADGVDTLRKYLGEEVWDAARAMSALQALNEVLSGEMGEPSEDGDQVAALRDAIQRVKDFIASEIQENHDAADPAMALAAGVEGLAKRGARNSKADMEHLQRAHDACVAAGACCSGTEKHVSADDMQKVAAERDALQKTVGDMHDLIKQIAARVDAIEKQPLPLPFQAGATHSVTKSEEMAGTAADIALEKMMQTQDGRDAVSLALIKASQANPMRLGR